MTKIKTGKIGFGAIFWLLVIFTLIAGFGIYSLIGQHTREVQVRILLESARSNSQILTAIRNFYTKEVVARIKDLDGLTISHNFRDIENAIPLPATLSIELSKEFEKGDTSANFSLVSEYPFPRRASRVLSSFEKSALSVLAKGGLNELYRFNEDGDKRRFQYAIPVIMGEACVACHNRRDDSPKKDWQIGDVRGIQLVTLASSQIGNFKTDGFRNIALLLALTFLMVTALVTQLILRNRRTYHQVEELVASTKNQNVELEEAKANAQASEARLTEAIAVLPDGFVLYDEKDRLVVCNEKYRQIYSKSAHLIQPGKTFEEIIRGGVQAGQYVVDAGQLDTWVEERLAAHLNPSGMIEQQLGNGHWLRIIERKTAEGRIVGFRVDITELKEREEALRRSKEQLKTTVQSAFDAIVVIDQDGRVIEFNPAAEKIFGYSKEDIINQRMSNYVIPEKYRKAHEKGIRYFLETGEGPVIGQRFEIEALHADGHEFLAELAIQQAEDPDGPIFIGYIRDVTQKKAAEEQILEAKKRAEVANRAKASFLAMMSHEIRTPLNGVLGILGLLSDNRSKAEQDKLIHTARVSGKALLTIINDILDFSKLEAGRIDLEEEVFLLDPLVNGVQSLVAPRARENSVELKVVLGETLPDAVIGDVGRIRQVLLNLTWNAIKFSEGGNVEIFVEQLTGDDERANGTETSVLRFSVRDNGIGIPKENHNDLFAEFSMLDASYSRKFGGTGLGLAISRSLVINMGGTIDFESTSGEGSLFWFDLPLKTGNSEDAVPFDALEDESAIPAVGELRLLLAEDNTTNQLVVGNMLERLGCLVDIVSNGLEALEAVQNRPYDAVLMDVSMPEMDGLEATKVIRGLDGDISKIPIIALTAYALDEDRQMALAAGMNEFVSKPVSRIELARAISRQVEAYANGSIPVKRNSEEAEFFDMNIFNAVVGGMSENIRNQALAEFIKDVQVHSTKLDVAVNEEDLVAIERSSHVLKAVAGTFGASAVHALATNLNTNARSGAKEKSLEQASDLRKLCELTLETLDDIPV